MTEYAGFYKQFDVATNGQSDGDKPYVGVVASSAGGVIFIKETLRPEYGGLETNTSINQITRAGAYCNALDCTAVNATGDITADGRVGIGTTTPGSKLHIVGDSLSISNNPISNDPSLSNYAQLEITSISDVTNANKPANLQIGIDHNVGNYGCGFIQTVVDIVHQPYLSFQPWSGNVGIGTANPDPAYKLDVAGNILATGGIKTGYVGIGRDAADGFKLDVAGDIRAIGRCHILQDYIIPSDPNNATHLRPQLRVGNSDVVEGSAYFGYSGRGNSDIINAATYWRATGGFYGTAGYFGIAVNDQSGATTGYGITEGELVSQTHLAITDTGNVGIGTTIPGSKLEVSGTFDFDTGRVRIYGEDTGGLRHYADFHLFYNYDDTNPTELMRIQNDGNVGIGITPNTSYKLDVNGNIIARGNIIADDIVGIGTTTPDPAYKLDVAGNIRATGALDFGITPRQMINLYTGVHGIGVQDSTTYFRTNAYFAWFKGGEHVGGSVSAGENGIVQMTLDSSSNLYVAGSVGIGKDADSAYKLDVAGDIRATQLVNSGNDFILGYGALERGDSGASRALVKESDSTLYINYQNDFAGGVVIDSKLVVDGDINANAVIANYNAGIYLNGNTSNSFERIWYDDGKMRYGVSKEHVFSGNIEATGDINGTNFTASGGISASGGITASGFISASAGIATQGTITATGNVGIGRFSPIARLEVASGNAVTENARYTYFTSTSFVGSSFNGYVTTYPEGSVNDVSIFAYGSIATQGTIAATQGNLTASDERIKENIEDISDTEALDKLRLLKPKTYTYKDTVGRGTTPVIGFIAQEVKEVIPTAVDVRTDVIPNIYELATVSQSNVITFTNFDTSNLQANSNIISIRTIKGAEERVTLANTIDEHTIQVVEDLTGFTGSVDENGNVITETVTTTYTQEEYDALESKDGIVPIYTPDITKEEYDALTEEERGAYTITYSKTVGNQIFVYGQMVDDFNFLRKESVFTVATAALQEVDRQQQADKQRIAPLESQVADLLARVQALESP